MKRILFLLTACLVFAADWTWADDVDTLIANVRNKKETWDVRRDSAWKLVQTGDRRAVSLFSEVLDDKDEPPHMVWMACVAVGKFRVVEKIPRLIELLAKAGDGGPAFALAQIKDPRVIPALCTGGAFNREALHYYVTRTDPGNKQPVEHLKKQVQSGELDVPLATLEYLIGEDEAAKAVPPEKDLVVTVDKAEYRREAPAGKMAMTITLKNISGTPLVIRFHGSPSLCMVERRFRDFHEDPWCIEVIGASKPLTPAKVTGEGVYGGGGWQPLRIEPKEVVVLDCRFLYESGGFGVGPPGEYVRPDNPQSRVRITYDAPGGNELKRSYSQRFSLITRERKLGKEDLPALTRTLADKDANVRRRGAGSLAEIGTPAMPALIGALRDEDKQVRMAAADALTRQRLPEVD